MVVFGVYIVSKSGGLIFNLDHNVPKVETEKVFHYPIDLRLSYEPKKVSVQFGQKDGIHGEKSIHIQHSDTFLIRSIPSTIPVGHIITAVNNIAANGAQLDDGRDLRQLIETASNYPLTIRFARPRISTNEKIFLASMFYPLFAIASQLSPETKSSGIEVLEADTFRLNCFQTLTGIKFIAISENGQPGVEVLLKRIYELYADYVLKNPFYGNDQPIRCAQFDTNLQQLLEQAESSGVTNV